MAKTETVKTETVKTEKVEKTKEMSNEQKLKKLMREINPVDALILVERIQDSMNPLKEILKTEKNPVLVSMYKDLITKVERNLKNG